MSQYKVILLLGSNINNPENNIQVAIQKLESSLGKVLQTSEMIKTRPVEFVSNNFFCNIALLFLTAFSPIQLLKTIKSIELEMGRTEDSSILGHYADRIIDIDIVKYGDITFCSKKLKIPHMKHIREREFSIRLISMIN